MFSEISKKSFTGVWPDEKLLEMFLEISQISEESTCVGISF